MKQALKNFLKLLYNVKTIKGLHITQDVTPNKRYISHTITFLTINK